jgi:hypothetical protein
MPLSNRSRSITFRLETREYEQLIKAVSSRRASISKFTRAAVINSIMADNLERFVNDELETLIRSLEVFDTKMRDLRRQILDLAAKTDPFIN